MGRLYRKKFCDLVFGKKATPKFQNKKILTKMFANKITYFSLDRTFVKGRYRYHIITDSQKVPNNFAGNYSLVVV